MYSHFLEVIAGTPLTPPIRLPTLACTYTHTLALQKQWLFAVVNLGRFESIESQNVHLG